MLQTCALKRAPRSLLMYYDPEGSIYCPFKVSGSKTIPGMPTFETRVPKWAVYGSPRGWHLDTRGFWDSSRALRCCQMTGALRFAHLLEWESSRQGPRPQRRSTRPQQREFCKSPKKQAQSPQHVSNQESSSYWYLDPYPGAPNSPK